MQTPTAPLYILPQQKSRTLVPKILSLIILGSIFYIGILVNIALLELTGRDETLLKTGALALVAAVIIIGIIISYHHARSTYKFYSDRIQFEKQEIMYKDIVNTKSRIDLLDKIFKTYSINLGHKFFIKNISEKINIEQYLQQLIEYAKKRETQ